MEAAEARAARVVSRVLRAVLVDAAVPGLDLLGDAEPEARLLRRWCAEADIPFAEGGVRTHVASRTALLLDPAPAAALLPFGDVPASFVQDWTGGWTASDGLRDLATRAGGVRALDAALDRWLDRRYDFDEAFADLPDGVAAEVRQRFDAGRFGRRRAGLVPKLGHRTIGHDLRI